jgi:DNA-binding NarL/FixJ family response regulator
MDGATRILIIARPGHFRSSLMALLKTLTGAELFPADNLTSIDQEVTAQAAPHLVLVDRDSLSSSGQEVLAALRLRWPGTRCLVLVDNVYRHQYGAARPTGADCVLAKSVPAGELLRTVQQMSAGREYPLSPTGTSLAFTSG